MWSDTGCNNSQKFTLLGKLPLLMNCFGSFRKKRKSHPLLKLHLHLGIAQNQLSFLLFLFCYGIEQCQQGDSGEEAHSYSFFLNRASFLGKRKKKKKAIPTQTKFREATTVFTTVEWVENNNLSEHWNSPIYDSYSSQYEQFARNCSSTELHPVEVDANSTSRRNTWAQGIGHGRVCMSYHQLGSAELGSYWQPPATACVVLIRSGIF